MYATIRNYAGNQELAKALVDNHDDVKSLLSGIAGFKAYYMIQTADGATSVTVFDDQSGAEESNRKAAAWIGENLPDMGGAAPQVSAGEVAISF